MSFRKDLTKGVAYTAVAKYIGIFVSLVVSAILARILSPTDFGTIAIATVFIGFITLLTGSGLSPAIIQKQGLTKSDIENLFSFTLYLSLFSSLCFLGIIPLISLIYENKQLDIICYLLSVNVLFSVLNIVPNALLFKEKKFKYIAIRTIFVQVVLGVLSVLGAYLGLGVYALTINPILGSILLFIISYRCYNITIKFKFKGLIIKELTPYSAYQIGFNILNFSYRNIDKLLIGKYIGLSSLGYYEKSYRLMMLPLENLSNVISPVLHPILSEYQNDNNFIFQKYKKLVGYFGYIGFVLTTFCYFSAKDIILIIFGPKWMLSVDIFRILSLSIGIQVIQSAVGAIFQATGNVKKLFQAGLISFVVTVSAIIAGIIFKDIKILSILLVISFFISFFVYHYYLISKVMKENVISFYATLKLPLLTSTILALVLYIVSFFQITNAFASISLNAMLTIITFFLLQYIGIIRGFPNIQSLIKKNYDKIFM